MKKIVASLAALAAVTAVAAPAAAQPYDYGRPGYDRPGYDRPGYDRPGYDRPSYDRDYRDHDRRHDGWQNINQRQQRLDRQIDRGVRRGVLTPREADRLRREFWQIARLESRYRVNGLSPWERADLDRRFDRLEAQVRFERRDNDYSYRR